MIFKPELVDAILRGEKTETRRLVSENPRSPWFVTVCAYEPGRDYALQPGRGKPAVARIRVEAVRQEPLLAVDDEAARREGFADRAAFLAYWRTMHGRATGQRVWVVGFQLAEEG